MKHVMETFWGQPVNLYQEPFKHSELAMLNNEITPAKHHHNIQTILSEWLTCELDRDVVFHGTHFTVDEGGVDVEYSIRVFDSHFSYGNAAAKL